MPGGFSQYLPNKFKETPTELHDGSIAKYEPVVGERYAALETAGRCSTLFQYLIVIVGVLALVTTKALAGAEVAFTSSEPSYATYQELLNDPKVLNLQCIVRNNSLLYGAFSQVTYEQSYACDWVAADLNKPKLRAYYNQFVLKSEFGKHSACKTMGAEATYVCELVLERCNSGKAKLDAIVKQVASTPMTLATLANEEFLLTTIATQTNQTVQNMLTSLSDSLDTISTWSAQNMPTLYAFMQAQLNAIQALRYRDGTDSELIAVVNRECARASALLITQPDSPCVASLIGDGTCHDKCNIAECLFDGSDCLNFEQLSSTGPNIKSDYDWNQASYTTKFQGYGALALGHFLNVNPDFALSCVSTDDYSGSIGACGSKSLLSWPSNSFQSFAADKCGDPSGWTKKYTVSRPASIINDQRAWADYSYYTDIFASDSIPIPSNRPSGDPPVAITEAFACDGLFKVFSSAGFEDINSDTLFAWVEHWKSMAETVLANCDGTQDNWSDGCPGLDSIIYLASESEQQFFLEVEYGAFVTVANENSGTLLKLGLDASLKRNSSGFAIFPTVNHELYYTYADVPSCSYTKKVEPEPATLLSLVLGILGGISSASAVISSFVYSFARKRIIGSSQSAETAVTPAVGF